VNASTLLRLFVREGRGARGRLAFFVACLSIGVAAVVAVSGLAQGLRGGFNEQARSILGADLSIASRQDLPDGLDAALAEWPQRERTDVDELVTLVAAPPGPDGRPGRSQLVELRALRGRYPLYGRLELTPARALHELLDEHSVAVARALLDQLGLALEGTLRLGGHDYRIAAVVEAEPDRLGFSLAAGPRVFLSAAGLERSGLVAQGSRVRHRALYLLDAAPSAQELRSTARRLRRELPGAEFLNIDTADEAQPQLRRQIARVESYLALVALLSLLVGGIGVAHTVRAWMRGRLDAIAVHKCLGLRPRELLVVYLGQTALLGALGSVLGIALGLSAQYFLPRLYEEFLPSGLVRFFQPAAAARGLLLGLAVALVFACEPLLRALAVPPVRVLRRDVEALPPRRAAWLASWVLPALGLYAIAWFQSGNALHAAIFLCGLAALALLLALAARALMRAAAVLPRERLPLALRYGLAALARPGSGTLSSVVALGLGVLVVLGMLLVERQLARELEHALPPEAPSVFLVDVQRAQWPQLQQLLEEQGARHVHAVPVVVARLASIDGRPVDEISAARRAGEEPGRKRWVLTREQRITYAAELPRDNLLVQGELWSEPELNELSLEEEFAEDVGAQLGTRLVFDVQGVPVEFTVTSLRSVEWQSFAINFFLVAEPGSLDDAPQALLGAARVPPAREQSLQDALAASAPNVTLIRVREVVERVVLVLQRVAVGVELLGGFTALAGVAILGGALGASALRRGREVALLKAIGLTRGGVALTYAVEYALIGLVAGAIGTGGALLLGWSVLEHLLDLRFDFELALVASAVLGSALVSVLAGLVASSGALARRPIETLRAGE
jgi:putative ABC transport system permease protein